MYYYLLMNKDFITIIFIIKISENQSNIERRCSKSYCQQPGEMRNQVCISEQSLISDMQDTKKQVSISEQLFHSQLQNTSNQDTLPWQSVVITELNEKTTKSNQNIAFAVVTTNRYESLAEENCLVSESSPLSVLRTQHSNCDSH